MVFPQADYLGGGPAAPADAAAVIPVLNKLRGVAWDLVFVVTAQRPLNDAALSSNNPGAQVSAVCT